MNMWNIKGGQGLAVLLHHLIFGIAHLNQDVPCMRRQTEKKWGIKFPIQ